MNQIKEKDILKEYRKFKANTSMELSQKVMEICKAGQSSGDQQTSNICFLCDAKDLCISCDSDDWHCASGDGWCIFEDGGDIVIEDPLF